MASFNKVILAGNLTRDPETRMTPGGVCIAKFSVAVNRTYLGNDGQKKEEVTFVEIDAFGKQAEVIGKYFTKGKPILLEGRLKLNTWEKNGQKLSKLTVVLEEFQFLGGGTRDAAAPADRPEPPGAPPPRSSAPQLPGYPDDDSVPF